MRELEAAHLLQAVEASGLASRFLLKAVRGLWRSSREVRAEFAGRSVGFGVGARADYQTPASLERTACTSRTAVRGPWRAPGEAGLEIAVMMVV